MASFVKAPPSCGLGKAKATDKQANRHKATFILLIKSTEGNGTDKKKKKTCYVFYYFKVFFMLIHVVVLFLLNIGRRFAFYLHTGLSR